jgi:chemotaxis signal transduction protein
MAGTPALRLLVFEVGGLRFGADADQVAALGAWDPDNPPPSAVPFQRAVGLGNTEAFRNPETCTVSREGEECTLIIESPDDLLSVETRIVRPLPPLVEPFALERGIWAVIPATEGMLLLVDLHRLATKRNLWRADAG